MFQLAWRWPILALVLGGFVYTFKYYTIGGIEHLHLQPRARVSTGSSASGGSESDEWDTSAFGSQLASGFVQNLGVSSSPSSSRHSAAWRDRLTTAEKFAMWQDGQNALGSSVLSPANQPSSIPPSSAMGGPQHQLAYANTPLPQFPPAATGANLPTGQTIGSQNAIPVPPGFLSGSESQWGPEHASALPPFSSDIPRGNMTSTKAPASNPAQQLDPKLLAQTRKTIRVASFNTGSLGSTKLAKPHVLESIVSILRQFDVVALQEIQSSRDDLLPIVIEKLNQSGRHYDYMIGPRLGRVPPKSQYAIVFDADRLETDRYQLYTVDDPEDLMTYEPLVAWFRCKEVPQQAAFTFSLINVRIDYNLAAKETSMLPQLIEAVQSDGRGEDDWILAGDIAGSVADIPQSDSSAFRFALRDLPTNVEGTRALDTIFFSAAATTEFTGRSGVFDFLRNYNLSIERALEISHHLPVWAEFSVVEGAMPGRIAPVDPSGIH